MAEIRCPNCGKSNPDILDVCQFCQTPLKPPSVLKIGQTPTKKNTGELESVLPDWLKDVRQQARDSADADAAAQAAARAKFPKDEPPDLLAGLASQASRADDEDVPDWLASLNPAATSTPAAPSTPEPGTDFFAQFNQSDVKPEAENEAPSNESSPWASMEDPSTPAEKDELSDWFAQASEQPEETIELDNDDQLADIDWSSKFGSLRESVEPPAPKEEEDLSWLHNLEETARQTGDLQAPPSKMDWQTNFEMPSSTPSQGSTPEDLSWLDTLGGIEGPSQPAETPSTPANDLSWLDQFGGSSNVPPSSQSAAPQEDLSWLNALGTTSEQPSDESSNELQTSEPFASGEDLSWLNQLGAASESAQPFETAAESSSSSEDMGWLNRLGTASEPSQPVTPQEDLSWMNNLGGEPEPSSTPPFEQGPKAPRQTAPLGQSAAQEEEPAWLKSAIERPSMPAPGDLSMDWFSSATPPTEEKPAPAASEPSPFREDIFSTPAEPASLSNQEVDSLFSVDMPDWLSQPASATESSGSSETGAPSTPSAESLAPVDLPSWVQAMRPVEAVISESTTGAADQPTETEGPLAGLQGVIPIAPIGSSRRPKAVSLKLQVSDEQQASAALLEQILGSETSPRTLLTSASVAPQPWLRWALASFLLIVLSAGLFLRSQFVPVSSTLPIEVGNLSSAAMNIPAGSNVLVVVDYEPSLAGEMEAISSPLLNQIALSSHPNFSFISTSPNGTALVDRLLTHTNLNQAGSQSQNLGYLPGGATGVLGFLQAPAQVNPSAEVQSFSEYSALVVLSDHAESGRVWVEQLQNQKQSNIALANQPLLMVASAQAGPLLEPYVLSGQISGMISGIPDAARYGAVSNQSGIVRSYWDTFGIGLMISIALIVIGSLWSLLSGIRARRADVKQG